MSLGETLRRERLKRNLDYDAVSKELKISPRILQAIEAEQFDKLPGGVFAKGFVRQYARMLGVDEEEAVAEVQRLLEPNDLPSFSNAASAATQVRRVEARPVPIELPRMDGWQNVGDRGRSSTLTALALVVGVMLVCSVVYGWWQRDRRVTPKSGNPASAGAQTAQAASPSETNPANAAAAPAPSAANETPTVSSPDSTQPASGTAAKDAPTAATVPPAEAVSTKPAPGPAGPVHVELTASEPVWVTARSDGKYAFSGVLEPNETRTLDAAENAEIKVGNAGGMHISLNGKPIGEIGPRGQVRTVQFTSGGFHIVVAAPKPLDDPIGLL